MKLILATEKDSFEISDVTLKDGIIPCFAGISYSEIDAAAEILEPAIWFKILIMNTLCIDCKMQSVRWIPTKSLDAEQTDSGSCDVQDLFTNFDLNEDCIDYINGLDEVFDTVPVLLSSFRSKAITREELYMSLIQLLHVNVLPNIKLNFENIRSIERAISDYEEILSSLNDTIEKKSNMYLGLKNAKHNERQKLLSLIVGSKKLLHLEDSLVEVLERDFKADLSKMSQCRNAPRREPPDKLADLDSDSDLCSASKIDCALEKLSRTKNKSRLSLFYRRSLKSDDAPIEQLYIKMDETESKLKTSIRRLIDNKMMLRSVIETMKTVVDELKQGCESYGIELNTRSLINTSNIIGDSLFTKSWTTLPQRVYNLFCEADHAIAREHSDMVRRVCKTTESILNDFNLQSLYSASPASRTKIVCPTTSGSAQAIVPASPSSVLQASKSCPFLLSSRGSPDEESSTPIMTEAEENRHRDEQTRFDKCSLVLQTNSPDSDFVFVLDSNADYISEGIEKLKNLILDHFDDICKKIQLEINPTYVENNFRKVWVVYESYFYENTIDGILNVFKAKYSPKVKVLIASMASFTVEDLDLADSPMSKLMLGSCFDDATSAAAQSPPSSWAESSMSRFLENSIDDHHQLPPFCEDEDGGFCRGLEASCIAAHKEQLSSRTAEDQQDDSTFDLETPLPDLLSTSPGRTSLQFGTHASNRFSKAFQSIYDALKAKTPKTKAHHLLRCLKNLTYQVEIIHKEICNRPIKLCSDDVMDALIILLCNIQDLQIIEDLYTQVQLLTQVLAQFLCNGEYHFALVQFVGVLQYLHDKAFMKKNKTASSLGRL